MNNITANRFQHDRYSDSTIMSCLELCSKPEGVEGMELARTMNLRHSEVVKWALSTYFFPFEVSIGAGLDIGCGGGATLKALHALYPVAKLTGVDYSSDMVKLASSETGYFANIIESDVTHLPFRKEMFSFATAVETLYFWRDLPKALDSIYKCLAHNGRFLIIHEIYNDPENTQFDERNSRYSKLSDMHIFTPDEIATQISNAGFGLVKYTTLPENNWIAVMAQK